MTTALAIVGLIFGLVSFATWSRPSAIGLNGEPEQWQTARGILFGLWTLALPVYSLCEWYRVPHHENLQADTYQHKVWSDVWTAGTVLLGALFGFKR